PGSRRGEVGRLLPIFRAALEAAAPAAPGVRIAAVLAPAVRAEAEAALRSWSLPVRVVEAADKYDAFAAAAVALAASGTVSTELAVNGTPHVVAYRVDAITAAWARRVMTTPFVSIVNIMARDTVIPEFVQEECRADLIADATRRLLRDEAARDLQRKRMAREVARLDLDGPAAADRAAETVDAWARAAAGV
ncbi:MAG: lipid-A-disaccharide synthase, partial [Pseudomonadota bacterium]